MIEPSLQERCAAIDLVVMDVDGVLSDGGIWVDDHGGESKQFHVRDGAGIAYWLRAGKRAAIISGRYCKAVDYRAAELGITRVFQGRLDKRPALEELLAAEGVAPDRVCAIGDDLADIPVLRFVGLGVAVADAVDEARAAAHYVTRAAGGRGAVRELVEMLLRAQGRWPDIVRRYEGR
jgi:3-deoxy-D-manno-octulosonate 8-phosphate phosphatase (KDO 8-P phosphatase)